MQLLLAVLCLALVPGPVARAEEDDWGFDDDSYASDTTGSADEGDRSWDLNGDLSLGTSYNYLDHDSATGTRYGNLSRLRAQLDLQLDLELPREWRMRVEGYGFYDFTYIFKGRSQYTRDVLDDYVWEVNFREVWIDGRLGANLDFKLGRQIVNWGRSDTVRVLDVLNPLDNREPGLVDIEDLRLPVTMARVDYFPQWIPDGWGDWRLQLLVIPEFRKDRNPSIGNDFNPAPFPIDLPSNQPDRFFDEPEYGGSISGTFPGWDVSVYAARLYSNTPLVLFAPGPPASGFQRHSHFTMLGTGGNLTVGSWLFKGEIGWFDGLAYTSGRKSRLDSLTGVEYYGINDLQIAFEVVHRHVFDSDEEDTFEGVLRATADFMNSRLQVTGVAFLLVGKSHRGSVIRAEASYQLMDALNLGGGIVLYQSGDDSGLEDVGRNDRLFLRLEYSF